MRVFILLHLVLLDLSSPSGGHLLLCSPWKPLLQRLRVKTSYFFCSPLLLCKLSYCVDVFFSIQRNI